MDSRFPTRYILNKKMCCKEYEISKVKIIKLIHNKLLLSAKGLFRPTFANKIKVFFFFAFHYRKVYISSNRSSLKTFFLYAPK